MRKSLAELLVEILNEQIEAEKRNIKKPYESEKCIDVLDKDITYGIRDSICKENSCGSTDCPLYVDGYCINNHTCEGIKVKIPARIIDAEAEGRKE